METERETPARPVDSRQGQRNGRAEQESLTDGKEEKVTGGDAACVFTMVKHTHKHKLAAFYPLCPPGSLL